MDIITNSTQTGAPLLRDGLVCRRSDWMDVFTFLAIDFGLRAVTVLTPPGSTGLKSAQTCLWALICPASGVRSALLAVGVRETGEGDSELEEWIKKAFTWGRLTKGIKDGRLSELEMAKRSGALCMLVPSSARIRLLQQDESNTELKELPLRPINPLMTSVHGQYPSDIKPLRSPKNEPIAEERGEGFEYSLVKVPSSFTVDPILKEKKPEPLMKMIWQWVRKDPEKSVAQSPKTAVPLRLSSNERIVKAVCTIFQILYGSYELYRMGGDHLKKYGYAAYEFTIIPYLSMSLMNLLVSCVRPTYPSMYIVYYRGDKRPESSTTEGEKKESQEDQGKPVMSQSEVVPVDENWWGPGDGKLEENVIGAIGYVYGDLTMKEGGSEDRHHHHFFSISTWKSRFLENPIFSLFVLAIYILLYYAAPYIIIQVLTGFDRGSSTPLQRTCIIMWIASGQICPDFIGLIARLLPKASRGVNLRWAVRMIVLGILHLTLIGVPICAGVYMVATMILAGNTCTEL